jgi:outer membrane receptor protein involved in Fe transport
MGMGSLAYAQDAAEDEAIEEVVVTGSRIKRADLESVSPLVITSSEEIKLSGFTRVEDMMNSLPQIEAAQNANISNGSSGTATLDLRGMGSNRTLVLVNGRRLQPGGLEQAPDINQIPALLVERAEVITGGASTTYGADAVAGVVNFVMKDDFEGLQITAGISGYQHNNDNDYIQDLMDQRGFTYPTGSSGIDGKNYNVDVAMGSQFADGRGHATVYATWRQIDSLLEGSRDYASCALNSAGDWCGGSGNAIVPNFYIGRIVDKEDPLDPGSGLDAYGQPLGSFNWAGYDTDVLNPDYNIGVPIDDPLYDPFEWIQDGAWDYWTLDPSGDGFIPSSGNVYNYAPINHFQRPDTRFTLGAYADYEINENFKPYLEVSFMRDRTDAQIAESGTFFVKNYIIPITSDIIDDAQRAQLIDEFGIDPVDGTFTAYIGKRNVEGGPRSAHMTHNSFRIVVGTEGSLSENWDYDLSYMVGSTQYTVSYVNDFFSSSVEPAILGGDYPVFGYQEITPESAAGMTGTGVREGVTKEYVVNGFVSGDLGFTVPSASSPAQIAIGVEYRHEVVDRISDTVYQQGLLLGQGGPRKSIFGEYDVKEIFAETVIPLVEGAEFAESLELELAARYSDYNLSGGTWTYKTGLSWQPIDQLTFKTSYNRAVRAPNVGELFSEQGGGLWSGVDPCSTADPEFTAAQCANTGVTALQYGAVVASPANQYNAIFGGNPVLDPETADTWSVGMVAAPLDGLRLRIDYWDITLKNAVGSWSPEYILRECGETGDATYCDLVSRGAGGSLWLGQAGAAGAGGITATTQNIPGEAQHLRGIDISTDYTVELGAGVLSAKLLGTYLLEKTNGATDCAGVISTGCFPSPEWRSTATLTYDSDSFWSLTAKWRYFSSLEYDGEIDTLLANGLAAQSYLDLKAAFEVNENVALLFGVNNVLDREPPMHGGSVGTNANTFAGYYDTLGRYLHANVTLTF